MVAGMKVKDVRNRWPVVLAWTLMALVSSAGGARTEDERVEALLGRMTVREKIGQLNHLVYFYDKREQKHLRESIVTGACGLVSWSCAADPAARNAYQRLAVEKTRLGIPLLFGDDVLHGTELVFPNALALAGSFEPGLFERMQAVSAAESRAAGVDLAFAPMCDIARDARWGRVQETCGEDPFLASLCVAAQVRGFQGSDPSAPDRIGACLKHYVGYGAVLGGRDYAESEVSEWELASVHLPTFRSGIAAGAVSVMSGFNTVNGLPVVASRHALTGILRDRWRFDGFVVSDWDGVSKMLNWGVGRNLTDASVMALNAGNDVDLHCEAYRMTLEDALKDGRVSGKTLDEAVRRVLRIKFRLGLFERPYVDETLHARIMARQESLRPFARECVAKSVVLLKNEAVLPLAAENLRRVAVIGPFAEDGLEMLGAWHAQGRAEKVVTLAAGLRRALPADVRLDVAKGCSVTSGAATRTLQTGEVVAQEGVGPGAVSGEASIHEAVRLAAVSDVVIMALGEPWYWTGENGSRAQLGLTGRQDELFAAVADTGKPVIAVVFGGRPLVLPEVWRRASAVLYAGQPGYEAGNGLADVLTGVVSPEGRLAISVPSSSSTVPAYYNASPSGVGSEPGLGWYRDVGRRGARFPFGFGLTYSDVRYSPVKIVGATAFATVTNAGARAVRETVQLYVRADACSRGWRPVRELRGFRKIRLGPGCSETVAFDLTDDVLGFASTEGPRICEDGSYRIWIAPDSASGDPATYRKCAPRSKTERGVYFATHFGNWYERASDGELSDYVRELKSWGCTGLSAWFDMHDFASERDPRARIRLDRIRRIFRQAKTLGMTRDLTFLANESFSNSPPELRADWRAGKNGYAWDLVGHYHRELCPSKPGATDLLLDWRRNVLAEFAREQPTSVTICPYDQGGCTCSNCAPWGAKAFLKLSERLATCVRAQYPESTVNLATWRFDSFGALGEWVGLERQIGDVRKWANRLMVQPRDLDMLEDKDLLPYFSMCEISMEGMLPWGGFGANPRPMHIHDEIARHPGCSGLRPYSEGIYEDFNKVVALLLLSGRCRTASEAADEYAARYFGAPALGVLPEVARLMEQSMDHRAYVVQDGRRHDFYSLGEVDADRKWELVLEAPEVDLERSGHVRELLVRAEERLDERVKTGWRWRLFRIRAELDCALAAGAIPASLVPLFEELASLYKVSERTIPCLVPPSLRRLRADDSAILRRAKADHI